MEPLWWTLSIALIALGLAGIVLPALPGTLFVLAGIVLGAWIDDFTRIGWFAVGAVTVLAILAWALDFAAGLLGAQRVGASKQALWGAAIGTVVGVFTGFIGVLFMPLVGAAIGEYMARREHGRALHVGIATWIGLMVGMLAKFVLAFVMIGIFVVALLF